MNEVRTDAGQPGAARIVRFDALAIEDARGTTAAPGSVLARYDDPDRPAAVVLAAGAPETVDRHPAAASARVVSLPRSVLIPGLVNAHTHLDLTHIGPQPFAGTGDAAGFVGWIDMVRRGRRTDDAGISESVQRGAALALEAGTVAVGDIAGAPSGRPSLAPWRALAESPLLGVSFLEFFGIGRGEAAARDRLEGLLESLDGRRGGFRAGLQPHAPNTVSLPLYEWVADQAAARGLPLATHLAETPEERRFIAEGAGPQRDLLERLGLWEDSILEHIGRGRHPVAHLERPLGRARFLAAHVNDADDAAIATMARTGTAVVYCPRASAYFGAEAHFGPHRYRDMLAAGVTVALGTDSIINLPEGSGLSVLDEMRFLHRRDGTDPRLLLRMATVNGAVALGLDPGLFDFATGPLAGVVAVEVSDGPGGPLERVLSRSAPPRLLWGEK